MQPAMQWRGQGMKGTHPWFCAMIPLGIGALGLAACGGAKQDAGDGTGVPTSGPAAESSSDGDAAGSEDVTGETSPGAGSSSTGPAEYPDPPVVFDVGIPDAMTYDCGAPNHVVCDGEGEDDPWRGAKPHGAQARGPLRRGRAHAADPAQRLGGRAQRRACARA